MTETTRPPTNAQILAEAAEILDSLLPRGWTLAVNIAPATTRGRRADLLASIATPGQQEVTFVGELKRELTTQGLHSALAQLRQLIAEDPHARPMLIAPWLSARAREILSDQGVSYMDATGNLRLMSDDPGLLVERTGAPKNPWPLDKSLQSLRGKGAMRALRALLAFEPPFGVRELASRVSASAATLSRVISLLEREGLAERDPRGSVTTLDWAGTIRRWAEDYDVLRTNESATYLQPRGLTALADSLLQTDLRYALTGSLAAREFAPFAPAKLAMVYIESLTEASSVLGLTRTDAGANVVLLEPYDEVVFAETRARNGLTLVNPVQLAVDLLTGPGRAPAEGEELLRWMRENVDAWRT